MVRHSLILISIFTICFFSCDTTESKSETQISTDTVSVTHFNILVAPDLSNRLDSKLYPRPIRDVDVTRILLKQLYPTITNYRRSANQRDQIRASMINENQIPHYGIDMSKLQIDLGQFGNKQLERINYLKGRSDRKFSTDTSAFIDEFNRVAEKASASAYGADLWSYLDNGLDNIVIHEPGKTFLARKKVHQENFRNVVLLLTDGYIEAGIYKQTGCPSNKHECYYLSKSRIAEFRAAFMKSGVKDVKQFFDQNDYRIIPVKNPNLKNTEILVLELYDRSLTKGGTPTVYPTDMDILKLFWERWLRESGVKRFELRPVFSSKEEAEKTILNFILNKQ